jgi:hypothetical protein
LALLTLESPLNYSCIMLESLPILADPYQISSDWLCGFSLPANRQTAGNISFWLTNLRENTTFEFPLGAGMILGLITPDMCELVTSYLTGFGTEVVMTQTFEECYTDLLAQRRFHEPLWLEDSGGVMQIPFTVDQLQQAFMLGTPPTSLQWLLNLEDGTCWLAIENQSIWFQLTHLTAIFDTQTNTWSMQVVQSNPELGFWMAEEIMASSPTEFATNLQAVGEHPIS